MSSARIPAPYLRRLESIRALSDESIQQLLSVLEDTPPILDRQALSSAVVDKVSTIPQSMAEEIISSLLSLYTLRARQGLTALDIAENMSRAIEQENYEDVLADEEERRDRFKERLAKLLDIDSLYLVGKANDLRFENEHILGEARILTDARPIFGAEPEEHPEAAVIVHTLRLSYLDSDSHNREFYIALDTRDVRRLVAQLNRADSKATSLKSFLESVNVSPLDVE